METNAAIKSENPQYDNVRQTVQKVDNLKDSVHKHLSILEYEKVEKKFQIETCISKTTAFSPSLFEIRGFPTRLLDETALWKYADCMHHQRFISNIQLGLGNYLTKKEFEQLKHYSHEVLSFSKKYGRAVSGKNTLTRSLIVTRILQQLCNDNILEPKLNILEIGPGTGYETCMLSEIGHNVISMDCTQALYIFQNRFYEHKKNIKFIETAQMEEAEIQKIYNQIDYESEKMPIIHLPWWHFVNDSLKLPKIDIIIANHMLSEMNRDAMRYTIAKIKRNNIEIQKTFGPLLIAETLGGDFDRIPEVISDLIEQRMKPVFCGNLYANIKDPAKSKNFNLSIFAGPNSEVMNGTVDCIINFENSHMTAEQFSQTKTFKKTQNTLRTFAEEKNFDPGIHISTDTPLCNSLMKMRETAKNRGDKTIDSCTVDKFYNNLQNTNSDILSEFTDDELFYRSFGKKLY